MIYELYVISVNNQLTTSAFSSFAEAFNETQERSAAVNGVYRVIRMVPAVSEDLFSYESIRAKAEAEIQQENFRDSIDKLKEKIKKKRSFWSLPFKIVWK
jgi:di/tripeptidase